MIEEKKWYMSKTIWGSLLAVAAALGATAGITIDAAAQVELSEAIVSFVGAIGALVAIYGRLTATQIIN